MSSLSIREAKENIVKYINDLSFPMEVKRLMLKEVLNQVEEVTNQEIVLQIKERDSKLKEENNAESEVIQNE